MNYRLKSESQNLNPSSQSTVGTLSFYHTSSLGTHFSFVWFYTCTQSCLSIGIEKTSSSILTIILNCVTRSYKEVWYDKVWMYEEIMTNDDNLESNLLTSSLLKIHSLYKFYYKLHKLSQTSV